MRVAVLKEEHDTVCSGDLIRWEGADVLVFKPDYGDSLEKRAYLKHEVVVVWSGPTGIPWTSHMVKLIQGMKQNATQIQRYTKTVEDMPSVEQMS